jgi:hypothetical protein
MNKPTQKKRSDSSATDDAFAGLSESEMAALSNARSGSVRETRDPNDLMAKAYEKSGISPLEAAAMRDPNNAMAKVQGPIIVIGGCLLALVGAWRIWNAWNASALSIGGVIMLVIGIAAIAGGIGGTMYYNGDDED